jgi:hypothetical protein
LGTNVTEKNKAQEERKGTLRSASSMVLVIVLAVMNIMLAFTPQFEIYYLAPIGILGATSVVLYYRKPFLGKVLSFGAAIISLTVGITAIVSTIIMYPSLGRDLYSFIDANLIHLIYLALSIAALVSIKQKSIS